MQNYMFTIGILKIDDFLVSYFLFLFDACRFLIFWVWFLTFLIFLLAFLKIRN